MHFMPPSGKGGNAGRVKINYKKLNGSMILRTCGGTGADPAKNGVGGNGRCYVLCLVRNKHSLPSNRS